MNRISIYLFLLFMLTTLNKSLAQENAAAFQWETLAPIPDRIGFAGSFAGVANHALIVAGGANFPDGGAPWTGSVKAWSDRIFVLEKPNGAWKEAGKLPQRLGYGVSINWKNSLVILGGSNEQGHSAQVWQLSYENGTVQTKALPSLPQPMANTCGVLLGNVIYVMGGIAAPDSKTASSNFWSLDLSAAHREWKVLPSWPGPSRMLSVAGATDGAVYLFSGVELIDGQRKYLNDAYQYLPATGWKKIADLPHSVAAAPTPAFANEHQLLLFGGDDGVLAPKSGVLKEKHPGFSKQLLSYSPRANTWAEAGEIYTDKKGDAIAHPNNSIWAPVTTTLTIWNGNVVLPGGEVRPATRTPNVLMAKPLKH